MEEQFLRNEWLIGRKKQEKLQNATVAIFGIGGVGSFACEALARAGVGHLILVDHDRVDITNLNRQIHATYKTIGKWKVDVMKERILEIYPKAKVTTYQLQTLKLPEEELIDDSFSYVIDAVDTITTKLKLIKKAKEKGLPILSVMGTGNKLDPTQFQVADIEKTKVCPLCKVMRKELKKQNITKVKVIYSEEIPLQPSTQDNSIKRQIGSISFVPSVAGLIAAGEVIKDICFEK